jgi:hypothetical protein
MSEKPVDVLAIGNAIVDVIADADDAISRAAWNGQRGMRLIDAGEAEALYADMGPGRELSGGSAANTVAGLAALGLRTGFIGQLGEDELGKIFAHDIRVAREWSSILPRCDAGPTGRCLILVTPDAQRTMSTFLGAAQQLDKAAVEADRIARARILYLEGYLWDPPDRARRWKRRSRSPVRPDQGRLHLVRCVRGRAPPRRLFCGSSTQARSTYCSPTRSSSCTWRTRRISSRQSRRSLQDSDPGGHPQRARRDRPAPAARRAKVGRAGRAAGRYDRRRRPVRCRLPCRTGQRQSRSSSAAAGRNLRVRSDPALRRSARARSCGACKPVAVKKKGPAVSGGAPPLFLD